ncbi:hypothetical protein C8D87_11490 [Lentzea atacamensis]|uniref:Uncharacterized protein n=1 Tax=Lentzea atacamensis TaxID=531938 RepID=A0ABX9DY46_9PSEU|nr:hypothetical protein [Lentzea atacamensis]RAS59478.1 hypothetical protein C8D87_11490 [Lentzea atacamensis]
MREHDQQDITDRIDALTNDAASWSADGQHTVPRWATAAPGAMVAIALDMFGARPVEISATNPARDIARHVGDQFCSLIPALRKVQFLVEMRDQTSESVNPGATVLLHQLLADVRDGHYIASDGERGYVRAVLDLDTAPVIHGPCLITGLGDDGAPAPLDDNFQAWFSGLLAEIAQRRAQLATAIVAAAAGIALEDIDHHHDVVVVVHLG